MTKPSHTPKNSFSTWRSLTQYALLSTIIATLAFLIPEAAYAQESPMGIVICYVVAVVFGQLGRALAVLAVMIVGIGATLGKVSWGLAVTVAVGVAVLFGSADIVRILLGDNRIWYGQYGIV